MKCIKGRRERNLKKRFSDNTIKLCFNILTYYYAITRVNTPRYHTTRLNQLNYSLNDSKFEVHDIKTVSSIT